MSSFTVEGGRLDICVKPGELSLKIMFHFNQAESIPNTKHFLETPREK